MNKKPALARVRTERYAMSPKDQPELIIQSRNLPTGQKFAVWLTAEIDGLCLGIGDDRQAAVTEAVKTLEWALEILQGPPPDTTY